MQALKFTLLLVLITSLSFAQQDSLALKNDTTKVDINEINEAHLKTYKNDKDFDYTEAKKGENIINRFLLWLNNILKSFFEAIFGVGNAQGVLYFIFNILPYVILAILIYLLIKFFLKVNSRHIITTSNNGSNVTFIEEEQILKNENIQVLINNAIDQKNYRLAIRYYYLLSLKYLSEKHIISWQQEKTNNDYIAEIKKDKLQNDFKNITIIYDYVWYGEFNIDQLKFETLKAPFENLNNNINSI